MGMLKEGHTYMGTWVMADKSGSWTVQRGRVQESFPSEDEALRFIRRWMKRGDKIVLEEPDGYRVPVRPRRRWRA